MLEQSYWSQGPGNFRDVNQNRREDVKQLPAVHDYNVRNFLSFVAADGYNQLTVATSFFKIRDPVTIHDVAAKLAPPGPTNKAIVALLSKPFRPGTLFNDMKKAKIDLKMDRMELLELVTRYAEQVPAGSFSQNGFWTDHFTYYIDLVHDFLSIYPDEKEKLLFDSDPIPFFLSPASVNPRVAKNMLVAEGKVRQYDSISTSAAKGVELQKIFGSGDYVGDATAGGQWQLTTAGTTMKVSILAKLIVLAANKFSILDPLGMGVEMEAGKPGWNDAMNGLPGLFGSEMPSAYELAEIVDFVGESVDEIGRAVALPEEVSTLLTSIETEMAALAAGGSDFDYWDKVHDALELYRKAVDATFTGKMVEWSAAKLGASSGLFGKMAAKCKAGAKRAATYAKDGVAPSYFQFKVTDYETLLNAHNGRGLPPVKVLAFEESPLPLFLEGPVRYLKTLKKASMDEKRAVYTAVAASTLHDTKLSMYKISENLGDMPMEVGRMKAFDSGWLENESIWLHMSYKWYLGAAARGPIHRVLQGDQEGRRLLHGHERLRPLATGGDLLHRLVGLPDRNALRQGGRLPRAPLRHDGRVPLDVEPHDARPDAVHDRRRRRAAALARAGHRRLDVAFRRHDRLPLPRSDRRDVRERDEGALVEVDDQELHPRRRRRHEDEGRRLGRPEPDCRGCARAQVRVDDRHSRLRESGEAPDEGAGDNL